MMLGPDIPANLLRTAAAGERAVSARNWRKGVALLTKAIEDPRASRLGNDGLAACHLNRGFGLRHLGRQGDALEDYRRSSELNPGSFKPYLNAGLILAQDWERYADGIVEFDKALALNPASVDVLLSRAAAHTCLGDLQQADADLEAALALAPDNPDVLCNLGNVAAARGDFPGAAHHYEKALQVAPRDVEIRFNLALALHRLGSSGAAEAVLNADRRARRLWDQKTRGVGPPVGCLLGLLVVLVCAITRGLAALGPRP